MVLKNQTQNLNKNTDTLNFKKLFTSAQELKLLVKLNNSYQKMVNFVQIN